MKRLWMIPLLLAMGCRIASAGVRLAPTPDVQIGAGETVVYCPTFLAAWEELKKEAGGDIRMSDQPALADTLNATPLPRDALPPDAFVAFAGTASHETVKRLQQTLRSVFGTAAPMLPADLIGPNTVLIAYSHLQRQLAFPNKFIRARSRPLLFASSGGEAAVQFFGVSGAAAEKYSDQVEIVQWVDESDFILRLHSKQKGEAIVLARMAAPDSLAEAIRRVEGPLFRERKRPFEQVTIDGEEHYLMFELSRHDVLAIPVLQLNSETNFWELCGRPWIDASGIPVELARAFQDVRFTLDETGARIRSTAYDREDFIGLSGSTRPRRFLFDGPFFMALWRREAHEPYLAVWVGGPDLMLPYSKRSAERRAAGLRTKARSGAE